jgi:hypothetical protein
MALYWADRLERLAAALSNLFLNKQAIALRDLERI